MRSIGFAIFIALALCLANAKDNGLATFDDYDDVEEVKISKEEPPKAKPKAEDEDNLEEDEFDGAQEKASRKRTAPASGEAQNFYLEYAAIAFICVYAVNFWLGSSKNSRIAQSWYRQYEDWFKTQFASTGGLLKDSQSCYRFYASGRRHCTGMLVTINLRKRHDLFSLVAEPGGSEDSVVIEIPMLDEAMEPFVFAICRKRAEKKMKKGNKDLDQLSSSVKSRLLPEALVMLSDTPDLDTAFLDDRTCRTMSLEWFRSLHFTDSGSVRFNASTKILRFQFRLPQDVSQLRLLTEMAIFFVDRVADTKLSSAAKQKNLLRRKQVAEKEFKATQQQRQEAAAAKRKEESPADAKAAAKKKEAKEKKAKQPRVKVLR